MTIEFAAVSIGMFLIVGGALIWKKLRVVEGRLALMQDELASMQNGIKDLHIMESRLFNMFMLNADSFKKAPGIELSTSASAAPAAKPVGLAGHSWTDPSPRNAPRGTVPTGFAEIAGG